jgi:hypothetical protein
MTDTELIEHLTEQLSKADALNQSYMDKIVNLINQLKNYKEWFEKATLEIQQLQQKLNANGNEQ